MAEKPGAEADPVADVAAEGNSSRPVKRAVALRYRPDQNKAPQVTAKGSGRLADRILELAARHHIPIRQDATLVQVLSRLDLHQEISLELYTAVAQILAFVYQVSRRYRSEMADLYRRLAEQKESEGDVAGALRAYRVSLSLFEDLDLEESAEEMRRRIRKLQRDPPPAEPGKL